MIGSKRISRVAVLGGLLAAAQAGLGAPPAALAADEPLWTRQFGAAGNDYAQGVATDAWENVILVGTFVIPSVASRGDGQLSVAKLDAAGNPLWHTRFGTTSNEWSTGVTTDASGNVFAVGCTYGALGGHNRGGPGDAWVVKFDRDGAVVWKRQLGTPEIDVAYGVATDARGNVLVVGDTLGSLGGRNHGHRDAWVAKLDPDGTIVWKRQLGSVERDQPTGVASDASGNVLVAGWTYGSLGGAHRGRLGEADAWVAKLDADGTVVWKRQLGTTDVDSADAVATDAAATDAVGSVFVAGKTDGSLGGSNRGDFDAWVAKLDTDGNVLWKRQYGTEDWDAASGVAIDSASDVYMAGTTGLLPRNGPRRAVIGEVGFMAKYDGSGTFSWAHRFPAYFADPESVHTYARGVATDPGSNVVVAGDTRNSVGGPISGQWDVWVARFAPND